MAPVKLGPPIPSLSHLSLRLVEYISSHPLTTQPLVHDPITKQPVFIEQYRTFGGLSTEEFLVCSVYPVYNGNTSSPNSTKVAVSYEPFNLGSQNEDHAKFLFNVSLQHNSVMVPYGEARELVVPVSLPIQRSEILLTSRATKNVPLYINPSLYILDNYAEIIRLIISDAHHFIKFPMSVSSMQVLHTDVRYGKWETNKNIYFHEVELLIVLDAFISRAWRERLLSPIASLEVDLIAQDSHLEAEEVVTPDKDFIVFNEV